MRVTVLKQHQPNVPLLARLLGPGFEVNGADTLAADAQADVVVTTHLAAGQASGTRAGLIHVPGAGLDGIAWEDLPAGCLGANVYCHEIPIAEYVLSMVLNHVLMPHAPTAVNERTWAAAYTNRPLRGELHGQVMTIVGTGHIGQEIAKRAAAFGMRTQGVSRRGLAVPGFDHVVPVAQLDSCLENTDFLVLCCPLDAATRNLIDTNRLACLPDTALLINVARGEVVDAGSLYRALERKEIAGDVLDVWYQYPKGVDDLVAPAAYRFDELENVLMTPHVSGWSRGLIERRYQGIADNIQRFAKGLALVNQVWPG